MLPRYSTHSLILLALVGAACGSSSPSTQMFGFDAGSSSFSFNPGSSSGTGTGTTAFTTGTVSTTTSGTGTSSGSTETSGTTSSTSTATSSTTMSYASSGITVTVIPDGTGDAKGLLTAMQNAKAAVHMEMYLLSNSTYISALESLSKSIDVKVVLNQTFPTGTASAQTNASSYSTLMGAGVNVKWAPANPDGSASGYTHEKAVIIDPGTSNEQVWIMTMNLDTDAPKDNREYLAEDTNSADVAEAESIFEADYSGSPAAISGSLVVAPVNAETMLLDLIETAKTSIDVEAEEIDESGQEGDLFSALTAKAKSGVAVRLVIEDSTEASQATAVSDLTAAGAKVVGYVYGSGLDIHAKTLVVDGATAYVGSENFTGGSLGYNRELGVIFTEASEVAKIESAIGTDFAGGSAYSSQ